MTTEAPEKDSSVGHYYALLGIAAVLVAALFWLFTANATAQHADQLSQQNAQALERKADKDDLREIKQDVKEIRDFLLNGKSK